MSDENMGHHFSSDKTTSIVSNKTIENNMLNNNVVAQNVVDKNVKNKSVKSKNMMNDNSVYNVQAHKTAAPVLQCQHLAKTFSDGSLYVEVLKDVNFVVQPSERIAIVGASGSGKSTLLHLLGGLDTPTSGHVIINGFEMTQLSDSQRSILRNQQLGFVYQFHHLLPEFTVLENVAMPLLLRGLTPKAATEKAMVILGKVGMAQRTRHKLNELSGGERQRTAVARALVTGSLLCVGR